MPPSGRREGISALSASAVAAISAADAEHRAQPNASATTPATGRASRMPNSSPLMTDPPPGRASPPAPCLDQRRRHLGRDRGDADQQRRAEEHRPVGSQGRKRERRHGAGQRDGQQPPALEQVDQRRHQDESDRVSDLGERNDRARGGRRYGEVPRDQVDQRLGVIEVRDDHAAGDGGRQHHQPARALVWADDSWGRCPPGACCVGVGHAGETSLSLNRRKDREIGGPALRNQRPGRMRARALGGFRGLMLEGALHPNPVFPVRIDALCPRSRSPTPSSNSTATR